MKHAARVDWPNCLTKIEIVFPHRVSPDRALIRDLSWFDGAALLLLLLFVVIVLEVSDAVVLWEPLEEPRVELCVDVGGVPVGGQHVQGRPDAGGGRRDLVV